MTVRIVRIHRALEADFYVRRDRRRRVRVTDGESLLRRWAAVSGPAFRDADRFTSPVPDPDELAIRLAERLGEMEVGYALSRLSAARFVEPYAPASVVDIYVDRQPSELEAALNLFPVDRGESVRLVRPSEVGVLQFTEEREARASRMAWASGSGRVAWSPVRKRTADRPERAVRSP